MIFNKKKKRMIDVRELQKKGVVKIPRKKTKQENITKGGFINIRANQKNKKPEISSNADFFGFASTTKTNKPSPQQNFSTESDGYNKREVDQKITDLDNKIYKLEQRTELLEKKLDINQSNNTSVIGW